MILKAFTEEYDSNLNYRKQFKYDEKIVWLNGCFDIFHLGHLKMINFAKQRFKDHRIIVGLNSDASIKSMDKSHPRIFNEKYRSEFLHELVDDVIIYDGYFDYLKIIEDFQPNFIIKGYDYRASEIPETSLNIPIIFYYGGTEVSSTSIYNKIVKKYRGSTEI